MATEVLTELKSFQSSLNTRLEDHTARLDRINKRLEAAEYELQKPVGTWPGGGAQTKPLSSLVVDSDEFKNLKRAGKGRVTWLLEKSFFPEEFKTTILASDQDAGALRAQRVPAIVAPGAEEFRIRDLVPRIACNSASVDYLREDAFTNAASPQVEGSAKAESALTFELQSMGIKTLAHWIPASRQILDDLPQLRSYIDTRLMDGLRDTEDFEILYGDGTGQHLSGLVHEGVAYETSRNETGDTYIDKIANAISQVEDQKLRATGVILNRRDWRKILKTKTNDPSAGLGMYIMGGPQGLVAPALWGVPVAATSALTVGTFVVGDFRRTALFDRMDARIEISTEHADYFTRNLVAIRAEERLALVVFLAEAVVFGSF